jgi:chromosomal replication initiation ATPase DnaA
MVEQSEKEFVEVVKTFYLTIKKVGMQKVIQALSKLNDSCRWKTPDKEELINIILNNVCVVYDYKYDDLFTSNAKGELHNAKKTAFLLIEEHTTLSHKEISSILGKPNHTLVSHAKKYKQNLNPAIPHEKKFLEKYEDINAKIKQIKHPQIKTQ